MRIVCDAGFILRGDVMDHIKHIDLIYGRTILPDSHSDPEIKKLWEDFDLKWDNIFAEKRRREKIEISIFYLKSFSVLIIGLLIIYFLVM